MNTKINEYWKQMARAENIVEGFYRYKNAKDMLSALLNNASDNDLLVAAKLAETRNCENYVVRTLWDRYYKEEGR